MMEMKQSYCRSWLDANYGLVAAAVLRERLLRTVKGKRGVVLTLTYDRSEHEGPRELYREASEQRHVRRFIARLSRLLGENLSGRWFCKLEFQKAGWVHWHMILLGVERIPHADLTKTWGHGHCWIDKLNRSSATYVTKYVCKGESLPAWLYAEKPRSVKIIRVSPGFWDDTEPKEQGESNQFGASCYRSIGQAIDESSQWVIIHHGKQYRKIRMPSDRMLSFLCAIAARIVPPESKNWIAFTGCTDLRSVVSSAAEWQKADPAPPAGRAGPLHLIPLHNPPKPPSRWLVEYLAWACEPAPDDLHHQN